MVSVVEEFHDPFNPVARFLRFSLAKQSVGYFPVDGTAERFGLLYKFPVVVIHCFVVLNVGRRDSNPHRHGCNRESCHAALPLSYAPVPRSLAQELQPKVFQRLSPSESITPRALRSASLPRFSRATSSSDHPMTLHSPARCHRQSPASFWRSDSARIVIVSG